MCNTRVSVFGFAMCVRGGGASKSHQRGSESHISTLVRALDRSKICGMEPDMLSYHFRRHIICSFTSLPRDRFQGKPARLTTLLTRQGLDCLSPRRLTFPVLGIPIQQSRGQGHCLAGAQVARSQPYNVACCVYRRIDLGGNGGRGQWGWSTGYGGRGT